MNIETVKLPIRSRPMPGDGEVDIWLTRLSEIPLDMGPRGSSRRDHVLRQRIQQRFFLRLLLAAYLGRPGKSIKLVRSDRGKPMLGGDLTNSNLQFNVSHSGDWLVLAVADTVPIGVDMEAERRLPRASLLSRRFLSQPEADWINGLDEPFRSQQFLKQWTAREALVKARGCGLAGCLGEMMLEWQPPRVRQLPADWDGAGRMALASLSMPDGLIGHIAAGQGPLSPRLRRIGV